MQRIYEDDLQTREMVIRCKMLFQMLCGQKWLQQQSLWETIRHTYFMMKGIDSFGKSSS